MGWATIVIAACSSMVAVFGAQLDHRALAWQEAQREKVRIIAEQELRGVILANMLSPLFSMRLITLPESEVRNHAARYACDPSYPREAFSTGEFTELFDKFKMDESVPQIRPPETWITLFEKGGKKSVDGFDKVVQKYALYLEPATLMSINNLQLDRFWMKVRLLDELRHTEYGSLTISKTFRDEMRPGSEAQYEHYRSFLEKVSELLTSLHFDRETCTIYG